jgi:hypothetical protein
MSSTKADRPTHTMKPEDDRTLIRLAYVDWHSATRRP